MERAQLRALTHLLYDSYVSLQVRRNGESPLKGIDTSFAINESFNLDFCRNGESPLKGIDIVKFAKHDFIVLCSIYTSFFLFIFHKIWS